MQIQMEVKNNWNRQKGYERMDRTAFEILAEKLDKNGVAVEWVLKELDQLLVEIPSWGFSKSGTRFFSF